MEDSPEAVGRDSGFISYCIFSHLNTKQRCSFPETESLLLFLH